jgi:putative FmdB family regulatory protein
MPIFEFRCLKCENLFEMIVLGDNDKAEMKCPNCQSDAFQRVMSAASYTMDGGGAGAQTGASVQNRSCPGGSCTTYNIPGPTR